MTIQTTIIVKRERDGKTDCSEYALPDVSDDGFHGDVLLTLHAGALAKPPCMTRISIPLKEIV